MGKYKLNNSDDFLLNRKDRNHQRARRRKTKEEEMKLVLCQEVINTCHIKSELTFSSSLESDTMKV